MLNVAQISCRDSGDVEMAETIDGVPVEVKKCNFT